MKRSAASPPSRAGALVAVGFLALLAGLALVSWMAWRQMAESEETGRRVRHTYAVLDVIDRLHLHLAEEESGERGYVITGAEPFLAPYRASLPAVEADLETLGRLTADNGRQVAAMADLRPRVARKLAVSARNVAVRRDGVAGAAQALVARGEGREVMEGIRDRLNEMRREETRLLEARRAEEAAAFGRLRGTILRATGALGLLALGLGAAIRRGLALRAAMLRRLDEMAHRDMLTGLPNRRHFADALDTALALCARKQWQAAVLFLDLDGFKAVNDGLGHDAGDLLLKEAARRLAAACRASDPLARLGGDEFIVALPDIAAPEAAGAVADKIVRALAEPYDLAGSPARVTVSIGVALFPADGEDADTLLRRADEALYAAKGSGKNRYAFSARRVG